MATSIHAFHGRRGRRRCLPLWLGSLGCAALLGACTTVESSHWNLHQLHEPDGSTRRVGELRNGFQQMLNEFISQTEFKVPFIEEFGSEKVIKDPLGRCLHNLNGLLRPQTENQRLRAEQINIIAWLSAGCKSTLSRERCALALGPLARQFGLEAPAELREGIDYATPATLRVLIEQLVQAGTPEILVDLPDAQQRPDLAATCRRARSLALDRNGARRLLVACAVLLERIPKQEAGREELEDLMQALGRQCLGLALRSGVDDSSPLVRTAALGAWIEMTSGRDARPYALALGSGNAENIQVAMAGLAAHGVPPLPEGSPTSVSSTAPGAAEKYWIGVMIQLLDSLREGPAALALCHGMSLLTGQPENLRPEHWIAWQLDQEALLQATSANP